MRGICLTILVFFFAISFGCAVKDQEVEQHTYIEEDENIIIAPSSFYEVCEKLVAGQKVIYSFETTLPVNFNVHYHSKSEGIVHAVKEDDILTAGGDMVAETAAIYCCMWSNKQSQPVTLNHKFTKIDE